MKKIFLRSLVVLAIVSLASSCQHKFVVEPEVIPPDPDVTISFSNEIEPIWTTQGCIGCHSTGSQAPDLTADNSYSSITNLGLIDTNDPATSRVYVYPSSNGTHYAKYTAVQEALILTWIEQGAQDN